MNEQLIGADALAAFEQDVASGWPEEEREAFYERVQEGIENGRIKTGRDWFREAAITEARVHVKTKKGAATDGDAGGSAALTYAELEAGYGAGTLSWEQEVEYRRLRATGGTTPSDKGFRDLEAGYAEGALSEADRQQYLEQRASGGKPDAGGKSYEELEAGYGEGTLTPAEEAAYLKQRR